MYINATLLLQAIHFGCAYLLLRVFLYRPVVAIIEHEQNERKQIKDAISLKQIKITEYKEQAAMLLQQAQIEAIKRKPELKVQYQFSIEHLQSTKPISESTVQQLASEITHIIVENINHVP